MWSWIRDYFYPPRVHYVPLTMQQALERDEQYYKAKIRMGDLSCKMLSHARAHHPEDVAKLIKKEALNLELENLTLAQLIVTLKTLYGYTNHYITDSDFSRIIAEWGDLDILKLLVKTGMTLNLEHISNCSCLEGHIHILKWIYEENNVKEIFPDSFGNAKFAERKDVTEYLLSLKRN